MQMTDGTCSVCDVNFQSDEVVPLIGTPDQVEVQRERLQQRRSRKEKRKAKGGGIKRKSGSDADAGDAVKRRECEA